MAETILIHSTELVNTAKRMRSLNQSMGERLNRIENEMQRVSDIWQSDAGSRIQEKFQAWKPVFEDYRLAIESYIVFLENTASNYEAAEQMVYANASQF